MKKKPLNDHLVTYYKNKKLSPQLRKDLLFVLEENDKEHAETQSETPSFWMTLRSFFTPGRLAYASVLLVLGYIAWQIQGIPNDHLLQADLTAAINSEIEMHHTKRFNVEFEEKSIPALIKQMDKLDFTLAMPNKLPPALNITGARYCSIKGKIAAQIHLTDSNDRYYTLYQTKLVEPLTAIAETNMTKSDLEYKLWHEDEVFFGFVGPAE